jgi:molybdate transport system substrate-binding protein
MTAGLAVTAAACSSSSPSTPASANGAGSGTGKVTGNVVVFAATSLKGAFDSIGAKFEKAHPGVTLKFNYSGSSTLATQINQDAPADVFASADEKNMKIVTSDDRAAGSPELFARNKLEIMVGAGNPKNINSVSNLSNKNIKVAVCDPAVPCGNYSKEIFAKAGVTVHPVSEETTVSSVVTKVTLGEADAGIVYTTDVKANGHKTTGVTIPPDQNVTAKYPIVTVKGAPNASGAKAFMKYVLSPTGQKVMAKFGFLPPPGK